VTELSAYTLSPLREGSFRLYRGLGDGLSPILLVAPAGEYPSPRSLLRLEHEYGLRTDLDGDWAARPVELLRRGRELMLVLADPGGELLERFLGRPMAVAELLRLAIPLAAALGRLHAHGLVHNDLKPANILHRLASAPRTPSASAARGHRRHARLYGAGTNRGNRSARRCRRPRPRVFIPSAPKASAATRLRASAMPPEATNGIRNPSAAHGNRNIFGISPSSGCPPNSKPSTLAASQPSAMNVPVTTGIVMVQNHSAPH
jgi:hypothetical protein